MVLIFLAEQLHFGSDYDDDSNYDYEPYHSSKHYENSYNYLSLLLCSTDPCFDKLS